MPRDKYGKAQKPEKRDDKPVVVEGEKKPEEPKPAEKKRGEPYYGRKRN